MKYAHFMSPDQPATTAERLRRRTQRLALVFLLLMVGGLGVGAWQLARSQSNERKDLRVRYDDRADVAAALVNSLFDLAFRQAGAQAVTLFGGDVTQRQLDAYAKRSQAVYAAVVGADGTVVARSAAAPAEPGRSIIRAAARNGIAISDLVDVRGGKGIESATRFPTRSGVRLLVSASQERVFRQFLSGSLQPLTPVEGGAAYVLDGAGNVLGAVSKDHPKRPPAPARSLIDMVGRPHGFYALAGKEQYFASAPLRNTRWHVAVTAPTSALYAPASGLGRWLPWVILGVLGLALLAIGVLARQAIDTSARIAVVNAQLAASQDRLRERAVELQRANGELQRSNADLEQFAYVASHDLSAPLRAVAGFSQLIAARYKGRLDEQADEFIGHMQEGVNRMQGIIDDLLSYSRVDRTELDAQRFDVDTVLDEVLQSLGPEIAERRAEITRDPLGQACGDPGQLSQVLQNLVANGMKFTAPGVKPHVHVSASRSEGRVRIAVRDNGIGIDPDHAERIFKMFQRLHSADDYPGTGIGLAISEKIVERHGGRIVVEPAPGGGSVFTFDVPAEMPRG